MKSESPKEKALFIVRNVSFGLPDFADFRTIKKISFNFHLYKILYLSFRLVSVNQNYRRKLMDETFTTTLNVLTNKVKVNEELQVNLEGDELMFYHALRADLDLLKKNPKLQTIHHILDYSKSLR